LVLLQKISGRKSVVVVLTGHVDYF